MMMGKKTFVVVAILDESTCNNCRPRHGKRIGLNSQTKFADIPSWRDCTSDVGCRCSIEGRMNGDGEEGR